MFDDLALSNTNSLWGAFMAETLWRGGVKQVVISPGSRSTPITFACARHRGLECLPILDERSAGFYALGLARRSGVPVVLVCTSGTAAANYLPAVVEARESGVPLLLLTADRPPEMRQCQSGQTIDQIKLFGDYVQFFHEMALPEATSQALRYLRQTLHHAIWRCKIHQPGPVHLNCPFRDPLAPDRATSLKPGFDLTSLLEDSDSAQHLSAPQVSPAFPKTLPERGLIIAGSVQLQAQEALCEQVFHLAELTGWPLLCDALGPWRTHAPSNGVDRICSYDTLLRNPELRRELAPDYVLQIGPLPTSKILRSWLADLDTPGLTISPLADNLDPGHRRTKQWTIDLVPGITHLVSSLPGGNLPDNTWAPRWSALERAVQDALQKQVGRLPEAQVIQAVYNNLPEGTPLFLASSMPVRDAEYFAPAGNRRLRIFYNRGANGIDGTLSTALGCAHGSRGVLLTGDLALLHDTNGFLAARSAFKGHLTIVCINNGGGGIFEGLPVAALDGPFEKFFATPQQVDLEKLAAAYGVNYLLLESTSELSSLLTNLPSQGLCLIEIRTDRKSDMKSRQHLFREISGSLTDS